MRFASLLVLACVSLPLASLGCAAETASESAGTDAETAALSAASKKLLGSYSNDQAATTPSFEKLVLSDGGGRGAFVLDVDTGIRCIKAPCPSSVHVEGTFTASASTLTLRSADVSSQAQSLMGRYTYAADSQGLTLTKDGRTHVLAKEGAKKLCGGFAARPCDSGFACVDDPNDACDPQNGGADCGGICVPASGQVTTPGASVLVPEVTKIVVENAGGGFVPPPPAGSACALGAAKYTLDLKSGRLDWAVCNSKDMSKPYMLDTGSRVLAEDELAKVASELAVVKVGNTDLCGADKPFETVTVTTPAGSFQYLDTFYGCQQPEKIHVNGIDEALDALRKLAVDCRTLGCDAGKSCQLCWTQFACVPEGALC